MSLISHKYPLIIYLLKPHKENESSNCKEATSPTQFSATWSKDSMNINGDMEFSGQVIRVGDHNIIDKVDYTSQNSRQH